MIDHLTVVNCYEVCRSCAASLSTRIATPRPRYGSWLGASRCVRADEPLPAFCSNEVNGCRNASRASSTKSSIGWLRR